MIRIKQFRYRTDNLGYLVYGEHQAMAVDGGAVLEMLAFAQAAGLRLKYVTHTHSHADHTVGTKRLLEASDAEFIEFAELRNQASIQLEAEPVAVYPTPGHTLDSVVFHAGGFLLTGDTLFNGTVGNCFSGDLPAFYRSIRFLLSLPDETLVYAGHDYVRDAMAVAKRIEPGNDAIDPFLKRYTPAHVRSTLAQERRVNPYLRFNEPAIVNFLKKRGLPVGTESERWESIMAID